MLTAIGLVTAAILIGLPVYYHSWTILAVTAPLGIAGAVSGYRLDRPFF